MSTPNNPKKDGLGDFLGMKTMLTGTLIRWFYFVGQVLIVLGFISMLRSQGFLPALIVAVFLGVIWRIFCEFFVVIFAIHERLVEIAKALTKAETPTNIE
jgi:hypothetical protein